FEVVADEQCQIAPDRITPTHPETGVFALEAGIDRLRVEHAQREVPLAVEEIARVVVEVEQSAQIGPLQRQLHRRTATEEVVVRDLALDDEALDRGEAGADLERARQLLRELDV